MATGKLPFKSASSGEICGAILHREPAAISLSNPDFPADSNCGGVSEYDA
jgi:hypothetical protein